MYKMETKNKTNGEKRMDLVIKPPKLETAIFKIKGISPLVIHRFSHKTMIQLRQKMEAGSTAKKGKTREPSDLEEIYNDARYISKDGWDGFNASAIRAAMISACRLVGFKMTLAKLSLFVIPDGWDAKEPEMPLVRILGKPRRMDKIAKVETGQPYVCIRPCYDDWGADIKIKFDADQFTITDVANLLSRVGEQVGIGEGRPDSKDSAGMGWGMFVLEAD
jgi:hypothetical protein